MIEYNLDLPKLMSIESKFNCWQNVDIIKVTSMEMIYMIEIDVPNITHFELRGAFKSLKTQSLISKNSK